MALIFLNYGLRKNLIQSSDARNFFAKLGENFRQFSCISPNIFLAKGEEAKIKFRSRNFIFSLSFVSFVKIILNNFVFIYITSSKNLLNNYVFIK
jgi:hypothetical protein